MIPALVPAAGEYRALTPHDVVPAGHVAVPVTRPDWLPHLRPGEFAIIDVSDTEPQMGEIYGLMIGVAQPRLRLVQPYRSRVCVGGVTGIMFRFGLPDARGGFYSDGPLGPEGWRAMCRGRVVGLLSLADLEGAHA